MEITTDFLVIGSGPSGVSACDVLAKSGKKIVLVGDKLGGAYCSEGSVVSNSILRFSMTYSNYKKISTEFLEEIVQPGKLDFKVVRKYIENNVNRVRKQFANSFERNKVEYIEGTAEFISPERVSIHCSDDSKIICKFDKCLIATGSVNKSLNLSSHRKNQNHDVTAFSSINSMPASVSIIGGGFIGMELATFFSRLDIKVTIIEKRERILYGLDYNIIKKYEDSLKKKDVSILTNKNIQKVERIGQKYIIFFDDSQVESEAVFVCIGRVPRIKELNLEKAGVDVLDGVPVFGSDLRTDNKNIFVAGDVTNILMHTGWAYYSASLAAKNMLGENSNYNINVSPVVIAVDPEIASVGLSEEEAKEQGYNIGVIKYTHNNTYYFPFASSTQTFIKAVYNKDDKTFLGVQLIGSGSASIISTFALLIQLSITREAVPDYVYVHPILNEFFNEIVDKMK